MLDGDSWWLSFREERAGLAIWFFCSKGSSETHIQPKEQCASAIGEASEESDAGKGAHQACAEGKFVSMW